MAPQYREAPPSQKRVLLEAFIATTGYVRKYARWLLNHAEEVQQTHGRSQLRRYGPDVQHALFLAWNAANRICAKRLIPFLPTLIEALERHEHLHISEECRKQLLAMSAATADRLLSSQRKGGQHGLSTTRAGTLLKQQIPIRTFQEWKENRPGFLEVDLVTHCGTDIEGGYLYTLTLTDIATGWTECLPLLYRSQEIVRAALQRARTLFPLPILGIDTDNGGEFINERVIAYCEQEQITFTRGRPSLKNDQYPSVSFPFNVAQRGCFGPRGGSPIRHQCCTPCTKGRKGENASLAGGTPRKTPSKESGSRSCPGW